MSRARRKATKTQRIPDLRQGALLAVEASAKPQREAKAGVLFDEGDRARLFVGSVPLEEYLRQARLGWVLRLGQLMEELDWSAFEKAYQPGGRPPLHPKCVLGLMMYGAVLQQNSLRQLETLARRDVGSWWLTAGLMPDHTTVARFVARHEALLTEDFFVQVTSRVAKYLGVTASELAIDGTIKEAASSAAKALRRDALDHRREEAREEVSAAQAALARAEPDAKAEGEARVREANDRLEQLEKANEVLAKREAANEAAGKPTANISVSPVEPDAQLQQLKQSNDYGLGYKPTCGATPEGLIVAQSAGLSETEPVEHLLEQHEAILGAPPQRILADAGFCSIALLTLFLAKDIDALIPSGRRGRPRTGSDGRFAKRDFTYDEAIDRLRCPGGAEMKPGNVKLKDRRGLSYREFSTPECAKCPLRAKCTTSKRGRIIKRYDGDELKDAMDEVLAHPAARAAYKRRSVIIEPVFARLGQGGFTRFRRRGLRRVRTEWALRCTAHNIALFLGRWQGCFVALFAIRRPDGGWCGTLAVARIAT